MFGESWRGFGAGENEADLSIQAKDNGKWGTRILNGNPSSLRLALTFCLFYLNCFHVTVSSGLDGWLGWKKETEGVSAEEKGEKWWENTFSTQRHRFKRCTDGLAELAQEIITEQLSQSHVLLVYVRGFLFGRTQCCLTLEINQKQSLIYCDNNRICFLPRFNILFSRLFYLNGHPSSTSRV